MVTLNIGAHNTYKGLHEGDMLEELIEHDMHLCGSTEEAARGYWERLYQRGELEQIRISWWNAIGKWQQEGGE